MGKLISFLSKFYSFRIQSAQMQPMQKGTRKQTRRKKGPANKRCKKGPANKPMQAPMGTNQMQPMQMGMGPQRQMMVVTTPMEPYVGPVTLIICWLTGCCCVLCFPCDQRPVATTVIQQW